MREKMEMTSTGHQRDREKWQMANGDWSAGSVFVKESIDGSKWRNKWKTNKNDKWINRFIPKFEVGKKDTHHGPRDIYTM